MKNSFRILIITILSVVLISCRTVKAQCGFSLMRDTVIKLLMSFLVIQVVEVLCYSMWESIIAYLKMMCKVHSI